MYGEIETKFWTRLWNLLKFASWQCSHAMRRMPISLRSVIRIHHLNRTLIRAARVMGPTLVALTFAGVAHAQGTMDFSGAQTLMGTFKTFAIYVGAVICFGGLIFAGIRMMSGRFQNAIPGLFGALFGAGVLGWGAGWIGVAAAAAGGSLVPLLP
jgi:hypothetical protein